MTERDLIVSAWARLGPTRATRALRAFDVHLVSNGWLNCPLAFSYGEPGQLVGDHGHDMDVSWDDEECIVFGVTPDDVAKALGLDVVEVIAITRAYDGATDAAVSRGELERIIRAESLKPIGTVEAA